MKTQYKVRVNAAPWVLGHEVWVLKEEPDGKCFVLYDGTWEEYNPNVNMISPSFSITGEQAQRLMDDLWNTGLRPSETKESAQALSATKAHLEDMRKIAFKYLNMGDNNDEE